MRNNPCREDAKIQRRWINSNLAGRHAHSDHWIRGGSTRAGENDIIGKSPDGKRPECNRHCTGLAWQQTVRSTTRDSKRPHYSRRAGQSQAAGINNRIGQLIRSPNRNRPKIERARCRHQMCRIRNDCKTTGRNSARRRADCKTNRFDSCGVGQRDGASINGRIGGGNAAIGRIGHRRPGGGTTERYLHRVRVRSAQWIQNRGRHDPLGKSSGIGDVGGRNRDCVQSIGIAVAPTGESPGVGGGRGQQDVCAYGINATAEH